jgi:hypothetical protein
MKTVPGLDPLRRFFETPPIPLIHTTITVRIWGGLALVTTERLFRNDESTSIEATITFPVPVHATLVRLTARIDRREVVAIAVERDGAREVYEAAIDEGKTAVLHEEVLRGVHQLSVGHVRPGAEIAVRSTWISALSKDPSGASLRIPTTVGELYGRSPLDDADDLVHGPTLHRAKLSARCDQGTVQFSGRPLAGKWVAVTLDRPIDLLVTEWQPRPVRGLLADGRTMEVSVTPTHSSSRALDAVILVDRSGSMDGPCTSDGNEKPRSKHQVLMTGLNAASKKALTEADRIQLWEFADAPRKVGSGRGHQLARLVGKLQSPGGGTNIGQALAIVTEGSEANDVLLVTDGNSYELDVQALARTGKRFHVVLVGEDSLEANVGHLAALTGGQIFVVTGAEAGTTIQTALEEMRLLGVGNASHPDQLLAFRAGMRIEANPGVAPTNDPDARLVGGFVAALQLPGMNAADATGLAAANGIACHLTSLVFVDEAGERQTCLPSNRKVLLSRPGQMLSMQAACAESVVFNSERRLASEVLLSRGNFFPSAGWSLRRWKDQIDWEIDPERLRRGDLSSLAHDLVHEIKLTAKTDEIKVLAAELKIPGSVVVLALLAKASPNNRAAGRFARKILKDIAANRLAETLAVFDLA